MNGKTDSEVDELTILEKLSTASCHALADTDFDIHCRPCPHRDFV